MTPREYYVLLRERWRAVLAGLLLGVLVAAGVVLLSPRQYESSVTLFVTSGTSADPSAALDRNTLSAQRMQTYAKLITSTKVAQEVVATLELPDTGAELADRISASSDPETVLLTATATDPDPDQAAEIANVLAAEFIDQIGELEQSSDGTATVVSARVFEAAEPATTPSSPRPVLAFAIGALLGLLAGFGLAVLRKAFDTSVRTTRGLADVIGIPVLGGIARHRSKPPRSIVVLDEPRSSSAEAYRNLWTNLRFTDVDQAHRVVLLTGVSSGNGTSTVVANLALAAAETGHRVLVVEADLRRPRAADLLDAQHPTGLADILAGRTRVEHVVQRGAGGVEVISSGPIPANPGGLLASPRMVPLLEAPGYDLILLDAAPVLPVADATVLAPLVDAVVLVVRSGTAAARVEAARDALRAVPTRLLGAVLTMAPTQLDRGDRRYAAAPPAALPAPVEDPSVAPSPEPVASAPPEGNGQATRPTPFRRTDQGAEGDAPEVSPTQPDRSRAAASAPQPDR